MVAQRVLGEVPFWFHTFALNRAEGIYTLGVAMDRYRLPFSPASFATLRVLDVGTFDGFYAHHATPDFVVGDTIPPGDEVAHYGLGSARPLRLLEGPDGARRARQSALGDPRFPPGVFLSYRV